MRNSDLCRYLELEGPRKIPLENIPVFKMERSSGLPVSKIKDSPKSQAQAQEYKVLPWSYLVKQKKIRKNKEDKVKLKSSHSPWLC